MIRYELEARDPGCGARAGRLHTRRGPVETPCFMPVGTQAAVRAMTPEQVAATGSRIVLANTYHLMLKPGEELVAKAGGLHRFMGWDGPILTDSGGFQVFSLPGAEISSDGVRFPGRDGETLLTPERAIEAQRALGADIVMAFDECTPYPADRPTAERGVRHTLEWLGRCVAAHREQDTGQALFGIVQGSVYPQLRERCARGVVEHDLPGYAIGGVSVGEGLEELKRIVAATAPLLPEDRPRYLMGVGLPEDLLEAIERGMDLFDCVIPTRYARSATLFTRRGRVRINARRYRRDFYPIDPACACYACARFTRAYLHHLYAANEILGTILGAIHNVSFYQQLTALAREAILDGRYPDFKQGFLGALSGSN